jgi:uncharacterized membrane protein YdjX (TVP38/TMEM64 family)
MKESVYRNRRMILMAILTIGALIGGYRFGYMFGKKAGHDEIMQYIEDKLEQNKIKDKLRGT